MDTFNRKWIIETGIPIIEDYPSGLTLRALHYRLVAAGMTNTIQHYKRVIAAMTQARWDDLISFDAFLDHERQMLGFTDASESVLETKIDSGKWQIKAWMQNYSKNRWENQPIYPEVFIEKKALQGVFEEPCRDMNIALCPCKGYPSLTFMNDAADRYKTAEDEGKELVMLYFGDYDPSGEDIPRSINDTLRKMGIEVDVRRIALMEHQVVEWNLPPAPTKLTDSRSKNWDGLGQVELDAVEPRKLQQIVTEAIKSVFDVSLHNELMETEAKEEKTYVATLKKYVKTL